MVNFYKKTFGFREPFNVLCDGTFVHYCHEHRLGDLQDSLSTLLDGLANPVVTRCVIEELEELEKLNKMVDYGSAVAAARRLDVIKCAHETFLSSAKCLATLVGGRNMGHYFVATVDNGLREQLRQVYGGALIYGRGPALALEFPSDTSRQYAKTGKMEQNSLGEWEEHLLDLREEKDMKESDIKSLGFKRKREAKATNPLSYEKKTDQKSKSQKKKEKKKAKRQRK